MLYFFNRLGSTFNISTTSKSGKSAKPMPFRLFLRSGRRLFVFGSSTKCNPFCLAFFAHHSRYMYPGIAISAAAIKPIIGAAVAVVP